MGRFTHEETQRRYKAIEKVIKDYDVTHSSGEINYSEVQRILASDFDPPVIITIDHLSNIIRDGRFVKSSHATPFNKTADTVLRELNRSIEAAKTISKTADTDKVKLQALNIMRQLSADVLRVTELLKTYEIEHEVASRPVIRLSFGVPVVTDKKISVSEDE